MKNVIAIIALALAATMPAFASGHSVALTCVPPSTGPTPTGYEFYRGTTLGGENYTTPINATPTVACAYTDTAVVAGGIYYYTVKSYLSTAAPPGLSPASSEVQAQVPYDATPNPPTGLMVGLIVLNKIPLIWQTPVAQDGFTLVKTKVYRGHKPTMPNPTLIATISPLLTAFTDSNCKNTCYYYLKAYDKNPLGQYQLSVPSNIVQATIQ